MHGAPSGRGRSQILRTFLVGAEIWMAGVVNVAYMLRMTSEKRSYEGRQLLEGKKCTVNST